jgi:hypothetical protein
MTLIVDDHTTARIADAYPVGGPSGELIWLELEGNTSGAVEPDDVLTVFLR